MIVLVMCGSGDLVNQSEEDARNHGGCGQVLDVLRAYRCPGCRRWWHRWCLAVGHLGWTNVEEGV